MVANIFWLSRLRLIKYIFITSWWKNVDKILKKFWQPVGLNPRSQISKLIESRNAFQKMDQSKTMTFTEKTCLPYSSLNHRVYLKTLKINRNSESAVDTHNYYVSLQLNTNTLFPASTTTLPPQLMHYLLSLSIYCYHCYTTINMSYYIAMPVKIKN